LLLLERNAAKRKRCAMLRVKVKIEQYDDDGLRLLNEVESFDIPAESVLTNWEVKDGVSKFTITVDRPTTDIQREADKRDHQ
jgi:hypothetical protein